MSNHLEVVVANEHRTASTKHPTVHLAVGFFNAQTQVCHLSQHMSNPCVTSTNNQPPPNRTHGSEYLTHSQRLNIYIYTQAGPPHPPSSVSGGCCRGGAVSISRLAEQGQRRGQTALAGDRRGKGEPLRVAAFPCGATVPV